MGREVKRVPLDFDWPQEWIWPGFMAGVCSEDVAYCVRDKGLDPDTVCAACKRFAGLVGLPMTSYGCPVTHIEPPKGDGWQLWETVSEGSQCSPVFATAEELAKFLADGGSHPLGAHPTYEQALAFVHKGSAPSMVMQDGQTESGVNFVGRTAKEDPCKS